jgi:hypothetical protein
MYSNLSGNLEKWFDKFADKTPSYSDFKTEFEDKQKILKKQLHEVKISIGTEVNEWDKIRFGEEEEAEFEEFLSGSGLTWEKLPTDWTEKWKTRKEMLAAIKLVQKRYWIREYVIRIILDNNLKVERINEFTFFQEIEGIEKEERYGMRAAPIVYPNRDPEYDIETKTHEIRQRKKMKEALTDRLKMWENTINFGVALTIHSEDVIKFLNLLLQTPQNRKKWQPLDQNLPDYLPLRITGLRVYNLKTYETRLERIIKMDKVRGKEVKLTLKEEEEEEGIEARRILDKEEEEDENKIKEEIKEMFKKKVLKTPYPVMLLLTGSVIDFDEKFLSDEYRWKTGER